MHWPTFFCSQHHSHCDQFRCAFVVWTRSSAGQLRCEVYSLVSYSWGEGVMFSKSCCAIQPTSHIWPSIGGSCFPKTQRSLTKLNLKNAKPRKVIWCCHSVPDSSLVCSMDLVFSRHAKSIHVRTQVFPIKKQSWMRSFSLNYRKELHKVLVCSWGRKPCETSLLNQIILFHLLFWVTFQNTNNQDTSIMPTNPLMVLSLWRITSNIYVARPAGALQSYPFYSNRVFFKTSTISTKLPTIPQQSQGTSTIRKPV